MSNQLENEERKKSMHLLKSEIKRLRDCNEVMKEQHQKDMKSKLNLQRQEYETIIKRHLSFIDKLLAEKDSLAKKCDDFSVQKAQDDARLDFMKQKELWNASEKLKRDKWINEKSKLIKENTIKSLEPEIQKIVAQHKQQMRNLEEKLRTDFVNEKNELMENHERHISIMKEKINKEKETKLLEEIEFMKKRYRRENEQSLLNFDSMKSKLILEFNEEKENLIASHKKHVENMQNFHRGQIEELQETIARCKLEGISSLEEHKRRSLGDMRQLEEKIKLEKDEWQSHLLIKLEKQFKEKELRTERDLEIDNIVQRLEKENSEIIKQIESTNERAISTERNVFEKQIKSMKEKINEFEKNCKLLQEANLETAKKCEQLEELKKEMDEKHNELSNELREKENMILQFNRQRLELKEEIRMGFKEELSAKDTAFETLHKKFQEASRRFDEMQSLNKAELSRVNQEKIEAIDKIEKQVMGMLTVKDEIIKNLRLQIEESKFKIINLENLVEKQRKELLF
ncbi:hypothetical protein O9G_005141 [Rozella allomycis CSF55]|uniref:PRD domain-containing protein n=1 Tax=Rozella allomycis (strain CSF55) TaxID=988480 RepID=A0A075AZT2_ROZAC|nr:hypothetical protein O9G_005141 [Rozella allomycis CSF55]|eukprot:EPZ35604.1 hypothetical protein O9G_005141 [Rozella allomycis CSF55]